MNKQEIYDAMKGRISMKSIGEYSDEMQIICKFGLVSWMGDYWDIWVTGIHKGTELGTGKVNNLCSAIFDAVGTRCEKLNGEAVGSVADNEGAYLVAVLLGARRKRKVSPKALENLRKGRMKHG